MNPTHAIAQHFKRLSLQINKAADTVSERQTSVALARSATLAEV
jgi:hypothetical protein